LHVINTLNILIKNEVQIKVLCICGKELPCDQHSCTGCSGLQRISLSESGAQIQGSAHGRRFSTLHYLCSI